MCQRIQSIMKPDFRQFQWFIECMYESLGCLEVKIWWFSCWQMKDSLACTCTFSRKPSVGVYVWVLASPGNHCMCMHASKSRLTMATGLHVICTTNWSHWHDGLLCQSSSKAAQALKKDLVPIRYSSIASMRLKINVLGKFLVLWKTPCMLFSHRHTESSFMSFN